eukprot:1831914-Pleurochrysis_carterae.AAC.1
MVPILHSCRMRICEALTLRSQSSGILFCAWLTQPDFATTPEPPHWCVQPSHLCPLPDRP